MKIFKNELELKAEILKVTEQVIISVSKKLLEELDKNLESYVYNTIPSTYERTQDNQNLKDSFDLSDIDRTPNSIQGGIQQYPERMTFNPSEFQHSSYYYDVTDAREFIAYYVNEGTSGGFFGEGYWTEKRPFFTETEKLVKDGTLDKWIKQEFKNRGF